MIQEMFKKNNFLSRNNWNFVFSNKYIFLNFFEFGITAKNTLLLFSFVKLFVWINQNKNEIKLISIKDEFDNWIEYN